MKPQDILVVLKLLSDMGRRGAFADLARSLGMSASESHGAFNRARECGLIHPVEDRVRKAAVEEFLIHGIKYVFPVRAGERTRGIPTGFAAAPLKEHFVVEASDPDQWVWPDPEGQVAGVAIKPLLRSAPNAAMKDAVLYEWLVLADVLRGAARAREREIARDIVKERLGHNASN